MIAAQPPGEGGSWASRGKDDDQVPDHRRPGQEDGPEQAPGGRRPRAPHPILAAKEVKNGFVVPGFGKLVLSHRAARMGRNPQTGAPIKIPAKRVVKFRVAKAMKDAVLGTK